MSHKGGHGTGRTALTGGSRHKTASKSEGKRKYERQLEQVNRTNRDEFIRTRRLLLAYAPQIEEYTKLRSLFDDVLSLRITAEEAEMRAEGKSLQEVIQRLAELTEVINYVGQCLNNVKHVHNRPLGQKAKVGSVLSMSKDGGTINPKDEIAPSQMRRN